MTESKVAESKIFYMYYFSKNLPEIGWIQSCLYCESYTSNLSFYKTVKNKKGEIININCYLCKYCLRNINKYGHMKKKYDKICKDMFNNNKALIMNCD